MIQIPNHAREPYIAGVALRLRSGTSQVYEMLGVMGHIAPPERRDECLNWAQWIPVDFKKGLIDQSIHHEFIDSDLIERFTGLEWVALRVFGSWSGPLTHIFRTLIRGK